MFWLPFPHEIWIFLYLMRLCNLIGNLCIFCQLFKMAIRPAAAPAIYFSEIYMSCPNTHTYTLDIDIQYVYKQRVAHTYTINISWTHRDTQTHRHTMTCIHERRLLFLLWPQYRRFTESPHLALISFLRFWHFSIMSGLVFQFWKVGHE